MSGNNPSPRPVETTADDISDFFKALLKNPNIAQLPKHLKQFIVDQNYVAYSPQDHSVWRYVLRQNHRFLIDHAHEIYFEGLEKTGLKVEGIPSIQEMNEILTKIGWAAVSVDGFIPPAAFMEFQAHRVLVIAADMRQIEHIEYTPSPDIIHEAAGHAPVIADGDYAEYLRRFGEVGAKAMSSKKDFELYEAIRKLSILKEARDADPDEIKKAEADVLYKQENLGEPSEMALLSRLHWWTVEYGLIGELDSPKIYGAGLLSSIGEAAGCLDPKIKKIPYDLTAADYAFDITTMQPQLFVTPDFPHLIDVLEQFADGMAYRQGGLEGLKKALECERTSTAVFSSGLQLSGVIREVVTDSENNPMYLITCGKSNLSYDNQELDGHGVDYHKEGFGSPVGRVIGFDKPLEDYTKDELAKKGIEENKTISLSFISGINVSGKLKNLLFRDNKLILSTFNDCTVTFGDRTLFEPGWGLYDMAVGENILSVFSGAADKDAYDQPTTVSKTRVIKYSYDKHTQDLHGMYQSLRDIREGEKPDKGKLEAIWNSLATKYPEEWLLVVELLELLYEFNLLPEAQKDIIDYLHKKVKEHKELEKLINDGIFLAENPQQYRHTWKS